MAESGKAIVILGGGVGGVVAANELRRRLPKSHRIVVVDREPAFVFAPSLLWVLTGDRTIEKVSRPLARLERKGITLIRGEIESIDPHRCEVVAAGRRLSGDHLIIALGLDAAREVPRAESVHSGLEALESSGQSSHDGVAPHGNRQSQQADSDEGPEGVLGPAMGISCYHPASVWQQERRRGPSAS